MIVYYHNHLFCYFLSLVLVSLSVFLDTKSFRTSVMFSFNISYWSLVIFPLINSCFKILIVFVLYPYFVVHLYSIRRSNNETKLTSFISPSNITLPDLTACTTFWVPLTTNLYISESSHLVYSRKTVLGRMGTFQFTISFISSCWYTAYQLMKPIIEFAS